MFITELEMLHNTRLMIRGTSLIKIKFTEIHQLILGTNGCGKSTIIHELSPLPPNGGDYLKGGHKKITIHHLGKRYVLTSKFSSQAGKHSFIDLDTGVELNDGGTQSVQRTLISEIFNYDQALHDVLTDQLKFTDMSPQQRRTWLTRISGTNLDYVMELFNQLKKAERSEDAVVNHFTKRLNKESDNLPTEQELVALKDRFVSLDNQLKEFYQYRVKGVSGNSENAYRKLEHKFHELGNMAIDILRLPTAKNKLNITSIDELRDLGSSTNADLGNVRRRIQDLYGEHNDILRLLKETEHVTDEAMLKDLKDTLAEHNNTILELKASLKLIHECDNAVELYGRAMAIDGLLIDVVTDLVDNTEQYFTKDKRVAKENELHQINIDLNNHLRIISDCEHSINHILKAENSVCPKCNHTFKHGVKEEDLPRYHQLIATHQTHITELNVRKEIVTAYLDEYTIYRNNYIRYIDILNANRDVEFLNTYLRPIDLTVSSPREIITAFRTCLADLSALSNIAKLSPEIYKCEAFLDKVDSVKNSGKYTQSRLLKIEETIHALKQEEATHVANLEVIKNDYDNYMTLCQNYKSLNDEYESLTHAIKELYDTTKSELIEEAITNLNLELAHSNVTYTTARNKQNIVDDITQSRDETIVRRNLYKILVNEINPTTGLIADYFKKFICQFVDQMNVILNKVWEHPIELLPCEVDSQGITYKFPLRVNDQPYGPPDGSKGSNSQVSMVNFAFKIVVMVYLGLDDYPLYLDELAPDLDEKHRINIITFVRGFVESKRCAQMFLVSHYATGYGAFTNAEILVLDEDNLINVPQVYNEHVKLIRGEPANEEV